MTPEDFYGLFDAERLLAAQRSRLGKILGESDQILNSVLLPGRFVKVVAEGQELGWGVVVQQITVGGRQFFDVLIPG